MKTYPLKFDSSAKNLLKETNSFDADIFVSHILKKYEYKLINITQISKGNIFHFEYCLAPSLYKYNYVQYISQYMKYNNNLYAYIFYSNIEKLYFVMLNFNHISFDLTQPTMIPNDLHVKGLSFFTKKINTPLWLYLQLMPEDFIDKIYEKTYQEFLNLLSIHRDSGAALLWCFDSTVYRWFKYGFPHRDREEGPQTIRISNISARMIKFKYFDINNKYGMQSGRVVSFQRNNHSEVYNSVELDHQVKTINYYSFKKNKLYKIQQLNKYVYNNHFDGPSEIYRSINYENNKEITKKQWKINGFKLNRKKYPYILDQKLMGPKPNKKVLLRTMLFDRDYGNYILKFIKEKSHE